MSGYRGSSAGVTRSVQIPRFWLVVLFAVVMTWGLLPLAGHLLSTSALRTDIARMMTNFQMESRDEFVRGVLSACWQRDVDLEPKDIHIREDPNTQDVRIWFEYTKTVKVFFIPREFRVRIEETTTNLGI